MIFQSSQVKKPSLQLIFKTSPFLSDLIMNRYCIEVDRIERDGSIFTVVLHRELTATKSTRGLNRQLENLVNRVADELDRDQIPHKRYTVTHVG